LRQARSHGNADFVAGQFGRQRPIVEEMGDDGGDKYLVIANHRIAST